MTVEKKIKALLKNTDIHGVLRSDVYSVFLCIVQNRSFPAISYFNYSDIANATGLSKAKVSRSMKILIENNLISKDRAYGGTMLTIIPTFSFDPAPKLDQNLVDRISGALKSSFAEHLQAWGVTAEDIAEDVQFNVAFINYATMNDEEFLNCLEEFLAEEWMEVEFKDE